MALVWTEEERKHLTPHARTRTKPTAIATLWSALRAAYTDQAIDHAVVKGRSAATPENAARMAAMETLLRSPEAPPRLTDVDLAAAFFRVIRGSLGTRAIELLAALTTPAALVEAVVRATRMDHRFQPGGLVVLVESEGRHSHPELRVHLLGVDDDARAQARSAATRLWSEASLGARTTLAFTFPEEEEWGNEIVRQWLAMPEAAPPIDLLWAVVTDLELAQQLVRARKHSRSYADLLERFGERFRPLLVEVLGAPRDEHDLRYAARGLSQFDDEEVGRAFAAQLGQARAREVAVEWFARFPRHALAVLPSLAAQKGRAAKFAAEILERAQRAASDPGASSDEATSDELPSILRTPPWMEKKRPKRERLVVNGVLIPSRDDRVEVPPADRSALLARGAIADRPPMPPELLQEYLDQVASGARVNGTEYKMHRVPDDVRLRLWNEGAKVYVLGISGPSEILARFGKDAIPGAVRWVPEHLVNPWDPATFVPWVDAASMALPVAHLIRNKRRSALAFHWLRTHPEAAIDGLVPLAVGEADQAGDDRDVAEEALRRLSARNVDVASGADRFGPEVRKAVDALLSWDGRWDCPKKAPKLPTSFRPEAFTRPRLRSGKRVPLDAVTRIGEMLAFSPVDPPYAGLLELQEACDPRSLAELAWDMARAWVLARHKDKDVWMLHALVHLADDEVVRRTTPGITDPRIVDVLEKIGTDAALMELATIAARSSAAGMYQSFAGGVEKALDRIAALRGQSKDELEESIAPTFDFARLLDFGERTFEVHVDETLTPYLRVPGSKDRIRVFPSARKTEDPRKVEEAKVRWRDLREDLGVLARRRLAALDRALLARRRWSLLAFRAAWVDHPLMVHLARGVIWTSGDQPFRVVEDRTFADARDRALTLQDDAQIEIVHPLRMNDEQRAAFRRLFDDYELLEPLPQLGRPTFRPEPSEAKEIVVSCGLEVAPLTERLARLGWTNHVSGGRWEYRRRLPSGVVGQVDFVHAKVIERATLRFHRGDDLISPHRVDPVEYSESVYDLHPLR